MTYGEPQLMTYGEFITKINNLSTKTKINWEQILVLRE